MEKELQFPQESTEQNLNNRWWWNAKSKKLGKAANYRRAAGTTKVGLP